jgi:hypothetical protein
MGRYYYDKKNTVDDTNKLDINWLLRAGKHKKGDLSFNNIITWTRSGGWGESKSKIGYTIDLTGGSGMNIKFNYTITQKDTGEKQDFDYQVSLTSTPCNFGGERYWFLCPGQGCQKRVGCLYMGQRYFLCRHCLNLAYESQNKNRRGTYGLLGQLFDGEQRAEELYKNIRWQTHYNGLETKRYKKYQRYSNRMSTQARLSLMQNALTN